MLWRFRKDPVIKYWIRLSEIVASEVETSFETIRIDIILIVHDFDRDHVPELLTSHHLDVKLDGAP